MTLAIFDLDNTLIAGDSDNLWGEFLVEQAVVDEEYYGKQNEAFYQDYVRGELDIYAYLGFVAKALDEIPAARRADLQQQFMEEKIAAIQLPKAAALLEDHRQKGHELIIITATSSFITQPIAELLSVPSLLAPELERKGDGFTGNVIGVPTFQEGKVIRLNEWLQAEGKSLEGAYFYSDSHNDLPLLKAVENPFAVDPDETLREYAVQNEMPIITLR